MQRIFFFSSPGKIGIPATFSPSNRLIISRGDFFFLPPSFSLMFVCSRKIKPLSICGARCTVYIYVSVSFFALPSYSRAMAREKKKKARNTCVGVRIRRCSRFRKYVVLNRLYMGVYLTENSICSIERVPRSLFKFARISVAYERLAIYVRARCLELINNSIQEKIIVAAASKTYRDDPQKRSILRNLIFFAF